MTTRGPKKSTPKKAKPAAKKTPKKRGRKSLYDERFSAMFAALYCKGYTDAEIAAVLSISRTTLDTWKKKNVKLLDTIKAAKDEADGDVKRSLFERACGYTHPEEKIFQHDGEVIRAQTLKHYPPDPTSMIFWLKNRDPENWRDKRDMELTGKDGAPLTVNFTTTVPDEDD